MLPLFVLWTVLYLRERSISVKVTQDMNTYHNGVNFWYEIQNISLGSTKSITVIKIVLIIETSTYWKYYSRLPPLFDLSVNTEVVLYMYVYVQQPILTGRKTQPRSGILWNGATNNTFGHKNSSFAPFYSILPAMNDYVSVRTVSWTHFHSGVSLCFVFLFNLLVEKIFLKLSSKIPFLYTLSLYCPGRAFLVWPWLTPRLGVNYPYVNKNCFSKKVAGLLSLYFTRLHGSEACAKN